MSVSNYHSAYFFCGQDNLLGGQFWAMGRFNLLGGQNNLLGGQLPTQLTCYLPPCSGLYLFSSLLEIKKVCSISSALNAQFYLFIKSRVGSDEHIYQYPSLFIVGPKIWTANKENSYFCWSRKIWLFFLIVLFIDMKNYTILLFSVSLGKICCTKLDLLQNIRKFYGQLFDMRILQGSERRPQSVGFNSQAMH